MKSGYQKRKEKQQREEREKKGRQLVTQFFQKKAHIPDLWRKFGSSVYYISTDLETWNESRQHCNDLGAHVVIIDSEEEQKFIYGLGKRVWIGLNDGDTETTWKWVNGKVLDHVGYWMTSEPNGGLRENCVEMLPERKTFQKLGWFACWNDANCDEERYYICEKAQ